MLKCSGSRGKASWQSVMSTSKVSITNLTMCTLVLRTGRISAQRPDAERMRRFQRFSKAQWFCGSFVIRQLNFCMSILGGRVASSQTIHTPMQDHAQRTFKFLRKVNVKRLVCDEGGNDAQDIQVTPAIVHPELKRAERIELHAHGLG